MADPDEPPVTAMLVTFAARLRAAGLKVGSGDVLTFCTAAALLDPTDLVDLYWAGRTAIVTAQDQIAVYDRVFREYFWGDAEDPAERPVRQALRSTAELAATLQVPDADRDATGTDRPPAELGLLASAAQALRTKDFAACTPAELAAIRRIMTRIRMTPPRRRHRRSTAARRGPRPDVRRTVRETIRRHSEPDRIYRRRPSTRTRRLVLVLDVSGSMADYSRALLQFAHSAARVVDRVEVFCFGTELTRLTPALRNRRPDQALARAAATVADWEGGTRIGHCLDQFVRIWGRRGVCRGAIVVVCSDGLDRGDPDQLARAVERLTRLCHRLVWVSPHLGEGDGGSAGSLGMMVVEPFLDELLGGRDLAGLERLAARLPALG